MKRNKILKAILRFLAQLAASIVLFLAVNIFMEGVPLIGIPAEDNVVEVRAPYPGLTDETKTFRDPEKLELAVNLAYYLRYRPFAQPDLSEPPLITLSYHTLDGDTVTVEANRTTVWWHGKAHAVKHPGSFINLTEGVLFWAEVAPT